MLTAKLKKESGGCVDKMELNKQLEIWETMVPKPESPGDRVFLPMKPEPSKVRWLLGGMVIIHLLKLAG